MLKGIQWFDRDGVVLLETGDKQVYEDCQVKMTNLSEGERIVGHKSVGENGFHEQFQWITMLPE